VIDAPAEEVREALRDERFVSEWLGEDVELTVDEAERVSFQWWREDSGPSRVELVVDAVGEASRVTVIETALAPSGPLLIAGWSGRLGRLPLALGRLVAA
jgi:uncharacterized protein YndB with AHSA1/START domain